MNRENCTHNKVRDTATTPFQKMVFLIPCCHFSKSLTLFFLRAPSEPTCMDTPWGHPPRYQVVPTQQGVRVFGFGFVTKVFAKDSILTHMSDLSLKKTNACTTKSSNQTPFFSSEKVGGRIGTLVTAAHY